MLGRRAAAGRGFVMVDRIGAAVASGGGVGVCLGEVVDGIAGNIGDADRRAGGQRDANLDRRLIAFAARGVPAGRTRDVMRQGCSATTCGPL